MTRRWFSLMTALLVCAALGAGATESLALGERSASGTWNFEGGDENGTK